MNLVLHTTFLALWHCRMPWTPGGEDSYDSFSFKGLLFEALYPWHQEGKSMDASAKRQKKIFHLKEWPLHKMCLWTQDFKWVWPSGEKKSNCSVQKKFSAGKYIWKFTGTANTSPVGNFWMRCTLHSQQYWNSAAPGTQIYSIFTNKNATNNSLKKEEFAMWGNILKITFWSLLLWLMSDIFCTTSHEAQM